MCENSKYTFAELCKATGKTPVYVKNIQRSMKLYEPDKDKYSESYLKFMEKIVALRTLSIKQEKINELFDLEKKVLKCLHFDSISDSKTWYLDACCGDSDNGKKNVLMLTEVPLDFSIKEGAVQHQLNFKERDPELFNAVEMGENVRRILDVYNRMLNEVRNVIEKEKFVLRDALMWAEKL